MRYLVTAEYIDPGVMMPQDAAMEMIENAVVPSLEALAALEKEGKVLSGGIFAGARGGVAIIEADSHEDLTRTLQAIPIWGLAEWTVVPLETFAGRAAGDREAVRQMKQGG